MRPIFVDANVFLRYFTTGQKAQHEQADALFRRTAMGKAALITGPPVLFEIAWVLRFSYKLTKGQTLDALGRIAAMPGLRLTDAGLTVRAIALAGQFNMEFADAYIAAQCEAADGGELATFNRDDFKKTGTALFDF